MSASHQTVKTPNPKFRSLIVAVSEDTYASNGGIIPPEGTLYKDPLFKGFFGRDYLKEFSDFRYVCQSDEVKGGLLFVRSMTQAQRDTPYRQETGFGNHRWCPILKALIFIKDRNFPRATNGVKFGKGAVISGPSYYGRSAMQPEVNEGSRFIEQYFFSDKPYNIGSYPVPIPRSVSYSVPGDRGSFPEVLGPTIKIPGTQTANAAFVTGSIAAASGALRGQNFPGSDMEEWSPYFVSDNQTFQNGYARTRLMVLPPIEVPDLSIA